MFTSICNGVKITRHNISGIINEYERLKKETQDDPGLYYLYDQYIEYYKKMQNNNV